METQLTTTEKPNTKFRVRGVNHIALVCADMKRTVEFYEGVLGMPLIKTCDLGAKGQHFFFDMGGSSLAFFWFPDAPPAAPGFTVPSTLMGEFGDIQTAVGSMNHVAFDIEAELLPEYKARLEAAGVKVSQIVHHNDVGPGWSIDEVDETNWCSSIYFHDPDGIQLEFAAWTRQFNDADTSHEPATEADKASFRARGQAVAA